MTSETPQSASHRGTPRPTSRHNSLQPSPEPKKLSQQETSPSRRMKLLPRSTTERHRQRRSGIILLNAAAALDGCDDQLLPASFRALESELKFHPSLLGYVTLAQTLALSLSCPVWGYLADRYPRRRVMAIGILSWGGATILLAFASRIGHVVMLRALNGLFLGSIGPISQSILADIVPDISRGLQFGLIQMCASAGRVVGGVVTTSVSSLHFAGLYGWRWTFFAVGCFSLVLGVLVLLLPVTFARAVPQAVSQRISPGTGETEADDLDVTPLADAGGESLSPSPAQYGRQQQQQQQLWRSGTQMSEDAVGLGGLSQDLSIGAFMKEVFQESFTKRSVLLLISEGIVGIIPWSAMSFLTMYFQYCGLSDVLAGVTAGALLLGAMISGPLGGFVGDKIHQWNPNHGRPILGQLSMLGRIPLLILIFYVIPQTAESFWLFLSACLGIGLWSIAGVVVNRPLLSEIVRPDQRATTFALVVAVEGACGALFGAPGVGYLAERAFGYIKTDLRVSDLPEAIRRQNAYALSRAMLCLTVFPWIVSFIIYGLLHVTYRTDRDRLQRQLLEEVEEPEIVRELTADITNRAPLVDISAGAVVLVAATSMLLYIKWNPPGVAFTYCWLFCAFLAALTESADALALAFCLGFGLNFSWYTCQLVDSLLWTNLIPYWDDYFPKWCQESLIRLGDILLHPVPLFFLLPYCRFVTFRIWFYAFSLERWYFFLVEGQPFGTGSTTNIIYDFRPHLPPRTFLLSQYLTNLGYLITAVSRVQSDFLRLTLQTLCLGLIIFVCLLHTDRWKHQTHRLPEFSRNLVGAALDVPAEPYTLLVNEMSQQLQKMILEHVDAVVQRHLEFVASLHMFEAPRFSVNALWDSLPNGYTLTERGLRTVEGTVVLWDRLADVCGNLLVHLHQFPLPEFELPQLPAALDLAGHWQVELPSLETFHALLPNVELKELATVRALLRAILSAFTSHETPSTEMVKSTAQAHLTSSEPVSSETVQLPLSPVDASKTPLEPETTLVSPSATMSRQMSEARAASALIETAKGLRELLHTKK